MTASNITRQELTQLARKIMDEHGLSGWHITLSTAIGKLGYCSFRRRTITISHTLAALNPMEQVVDTILHEVAHALVGPHAAHGPAWQAMARRVGAEPRATAREVTLPPPKWVGTCSACGQTYRRDRLTQSARGAACTPCCKLHAGGEWSADYLLTWVRA